MQRDIIDRRSWVVLVGLGGLFAALGLRLYYLQIIQHDRFSQLALRQQERTIEIQPARGTIYDRLGRPLALNVQAQSFFAVPSEIKQPGWAAWQLSRRVKIPSRVLEARFRSSRAFVWIKRKVPDETAQAIQTLKLEGIHSLPEPKRVYPEGVLACHVLGFAGLDNQGLSGVELQFDRAIRGQSGWIRVAQDAKGRQIATSVKIFKQPEPGQDLYLTLDKVVQHVAERELEQGIIATKARSGSVVVMVPRTGEILALANKPDFDPNHFAKSSPAARRNRAISDVYEPGSTFKIVTAAAALEENLFREREMIDCENGQATFSGLVVRDHEPRGKLSFAEVIIFSSNIGTVKIGLKLGTERLTHYVRAFGFGHCTGIELPGEAFGLLKPRRQWQRWNLVSLPFGQGVAVTTLQIVSAYAAIANQGRLPKPTILKALRTSDQTEVLTGKPEFREQAVSPATARRLAAILKAAVEKGTGREAALPQYAVAGKTGTAQKPLPHGGYDPYYHVASFIGFFPAEDPQVLIAVVIDAPGGVQWGGQVAAPIFRAIGQELVAYLGIHPVTAANFAEVKMPAASAPRQENNQLVLLTVPEVSGKGAEAAKQTLSAAGLNVLCLGKGETVAKQIPLPGKKITAHATVVLYLEDCTQPYPTIVVPDVAGQTLRNAVQVLTAYGLKVRITGSGIVQLQTPPANAPAHFGQICSLHCQDPEGFSR